MERYLLQGSAMCVVVSMIERRGWSGICCKGLLCVLLSL